MSTRCTAMTGKRHAPDGPRRCNHDTTIKPYCWQHLKEKEGVRVTKVPDAALGLITTQLREKSSKFGSHVVQYAQPAIRPNAKKIGRLLKAIKEIPKNAEVFVPASLAVKIPIPIVKIVKRKMKLIKPDHGPDLPPLILAVSPVKKVKRAKPEKRVPRSNSDKHEIFILKRVIALQDLWNDAKLAHSLKIPVSQPRVINVPPRGDKLFNTALEKLYRKEMDKYVDWVNKNPRNAMTRAKLHDILDKIVQKK